MVHLYQGDCLEVLKTFPDNSIEALVTDPPAGISFMNKEWDDDKGGRDAWIAWMREVMKECLRVLKPGAHGLVWAIPRTSHWTGTALEQAGFEVRDVITHLFGTGFPKSLDISKAIDKAAGAERKVVGINPSSRPNSKVIGNRGFDAGLGAGISAGIQSITAPATDAAKQWEGWGTALKPACEFWFLVRKPLEKGHTVAANVLKWGTGGLNIDAGRIGTDTIKINGGGVFPEGHGGRATWKPINTTHQGRFPANLVLDETAAEMLDAQTKETRAGKPAMGGKCPAIRSPVPGLDQGGQTERKQVQRYETGDISGASRFFYVAKASKSDKGDDNTHPTVKSTKLMEYLIKLITPPNAVVLDPFMGSGSTGVACKNLSVEFVGIEQQQEYYDIAKKRTAG